jgi:O-antigen/teichoic acid export membrane protein
VSLKKNVIANYLGQGWTGLMSLAFIPLYIKYLGIESYGLIGLFAILQAWLVLLDMGMTPALGREIARFNGGANDAQYVRNLLRSIEIVVLCIAILIAIGIWLASDWLASDWLKSEKLPTEVVAQAFVIMGIVTALRFIEGIYHACVIGLQRQVQFNIINSSTATLRAIGAIIVLIWISPTIIAFFIWQGIVSIITLTLMASTTYYNLPTSDYRSHFSLNILKNVWRFAGSMTGITLLALLLTQTDKIILTKSLTLTEYGYYAIASTVAGALYMLVMPINQAWFPKLNELHARNNNIDFIEKYHQGSQLISVIMGSLAIILAIFSENIIFIWTQNKEFTQHTSTLVSILTLGNLLNGLMWIPYQAQLAYGWTHLAIWINIIAVLIIVPSIILITPHYGAEGAAWVWVALNIGYVLVGIHFMHLKILQTEKWHWYKYDVIFPLGIGAIIAILIKCITPIEHISFPLQILFIGLTSCVIFISASLAAPSIRRQILSLPWIKTLKIRT